MEDLIAEEMQAVTLSHSGYIKRLPLTTYRTQHRGGKGVSGGDTQEDDFIEHFYVASTHAYLLCFTNRGQIYWLKVYDIPAAGPDQRRPVDRQRPVAQARRRRSPASSRFAGSSTANTC